MGLSFYFVDVLGGEGAVKKNVRWRFFRSWRESIRAASKSGDGAERLPVSMCQGLVWSERLEENRLMCMLFELISAERLEKIFV